MSQIYDTTRRLCKSFEWKFKEAFIFNLLLALFMGIEEKWLNSFIKSMYPGHNFLSSLKRSRVLKNHIFSPPSFIVFFSMFMALAAIPVQKTLQINILIGFSCFLLFSVIMPGVILRGDRYLRFSIDDIRSMGFTLFIIGSAFLAITLTDVGGIPLLKPSLRYLLNPKLTIPVYLMIPGTAFMLAYITDKMQKSVIDRSTARFRAITVSLTCLVMLALLGYRTPLVAVILITFIMGYYSGLFEIWEVLGSFAVALMIIMDIGYFRSVEEYSLSNLGPLTVLKMRASFTMSILNRLSALAGMTGVMHGDLTLSMIPGAGSGPRALIGKLVLWRTGVTITPTLFGQMLVEFGTIGVAFGMSILGLILGIGYRIMQKTRDSFYIMLYSIVMAYCLISIETGILDQLVVIYILCAFIIYIYNIYLNI